MAQECPAGWYHNANSCVIDISVPSYDEEIEEYVCPPGYRYNTMPVSGGHGWCMPDDAGLPQDPNSKMGYMPGELALYANTQYTLDGGAIIVEGAGGGTGGGVDICAEYPGIAACEVAGTPTGSVNGSDWSDAVEGTIETGSASVNWTSWFSIAGGACQMIFGGNIMGQSVTWDFCSYFLTVRDFLAWVLGVLTVVAIGRVFFGSAP